jgi:hypothetical protein
VSANTAIDWDTEVADFGGYWSSGAEVTVPSDSAGWHLLTTNLVKDLGTAWYSAGNLTQGASSATWPSGNYASLYEGIIGGTYDEHHSNAFCANIPAGGTARQLVNWFTGGGSRTVEAGAKFGIAKIWAAPSRGAAVRRISDVSISNATDTTAGFSTEDLDQGGYFDSGTSTTRLTVPTGETGWYVITAHNRWDLTSTGATLRKIMLRKNGAGPWLGARQVCLTGGGLNAGHSTPVVAIAYLAATDYVEMRIRHTHGSALDSKYVAMSLAKADVASTVGARVSYAGSAQTVNSGSTAISFDTEENDDDGMVDLGTNATRITATVDGLYAIAGHVGFAANTGTTRQAILRVDGTTEIAKDGSRSDAAGTNTPILNPGAVYYLTAGQYVELVAITGTNTTTATGDDRPQLAMLLLGEDA